MKYILKNIKSLIRNYKTIFILLVVTIAVSTLTLHFSYGLFRAYKEKEKLSRRGTNQLTLELHGSYEQEVQDRMDDSMEIMGDLALQKYEKKNDKKDVTVSDMKHFCTMLSKEVTNKLLNVHTGILIGMYRFETDFLIDSGKIVNNRDYGFDSLCNFNYGAGTGNIFQYGRYFTDEEYAKGKKVCIMYGFRNEPRGDYLKKNLTDSAHVMLEGEKYQIIALQNGIGTGYIPITSVTEGHILLDNITFRFKDNISLREIHLLNDTAKKCLGNQVESLSHLQEDDENPYFYRTMILLLFVVSLAAAFNFCALYHYIMITRKRTLRIFRMCGMGLWKCIRLYIGECSVLSVGTYLVSFLIFHFILMPFLANMIDIFDFHYPCRVYFILFTVYFVSSFLLEFFMITFYLRRKTLC